MRILFFICIFFICSFSTNIKAQISIQHQLLNSYCSRLIPPPADTMFYSFSGDTLTLQVIRWGHACQSPSASIQLFSDTLFITIQDTSKLLCLADCAYWSTYRLFGLSDSNYVINIDSNNYQIDRFFPTRYPYFAPIGAKWYYSASGQGAAPTDSEYYLYESKKDTIVGKQTCKKLEITYYRYQGDSVKIEPLFVYSTKNKVYYFNPQYNRFLLLYDFDVAIGDTLEFFIPDTSLIVNDSTFRLVVDSTTWFTGNYERLKSVHTSPLDSWWYWDGYIEEVGSDFLMLPQPSSIFPGWDGPLRCYVENAYTINLTNLPCDYRLISGLNESDSKMEFKVFPNPATGLLKLEVNNRIKINKIRLYSNSGELVKDFAPQQRLLNIESLAKGVYILELTSENAKLSKKLLVE